MADLVAAEYVNQLEKHPADTSTREKLAVLYAEHYRRADLAVEQLSSLSPCPMRRPSTSRAGATSCDASHRDRQRRNGRKNGIAPGRRRFPKSALAEVAKLRLAGLANELRSTAITPSKALGAYEKDLGLKKPAA